MSTRRGSLGWWRGITVLALLAGDCGGDDPAGGGDRVDLGTVELHGAVTRPAGLSLRASQLRVVNGAGAAAVTADGSFDVVTYGGGRQLAFVAPPSDNPLLMGWLDGAHTTIDARSTGEVRPARTTTTTCSPAASTVGRSSSPTRPI